MDERFAKIAAEKAASEPLPDTAAEHTPAPLTPTEAEKAQEPPKQPKPQKKKKKKKK
jgi:hypothetical protein